MSDLFRYYSGSDKEPSPWGQDGFLNRLGKALEAEGLTVWFDKSDIHPTFDYQKEINTGIEGANNFLFVISPASVGSPYCAAEVDRAVALNKRLIPLMRVKTPDTDVPTPFRNLDWIFARDEDSWDTTVNKIVTAVRSGDQTYLQTHTRLFARAREWNDSGRKPAFSLPRDNLHALL